MSESKRPKWETVPASYRDFLAGSDERAYEQLGAHWTERAGRPAVRFAVWAPCALDVSVVGTFNDWDGRVHRMSRVGGTGVWEATIEAAREGSLYKYEIRTQWGGRKLVKADPFAFATELPPNTASRVPARGAYRWRDGAWLKSRARRQRLDAPISIYEVHLGSWRNDRDPDDEEPSWPTYRRLADELVPYAKDLGFTHLELMPVTEHPYDGSWGYQATSYFAPTSRYGTPDDFRAFVDTAHRAGLGVILDWVPGHFPRDAHGLAFFDGTHLFEHADPRRGAHPDWGTLIFHFGRPQVVSFLISSAVYWIEQFHVDGLRVDAVASMLYLDYSRKEGEWVPNVRGGRENLEAVAFLERLNEVVHRRFPGVLVCAEESTSWPGVTKPTSAGGLGFDLKWNMGWMNDTLSYFRRDPIVRSRHHQKLSFSLTYAFTEAFLLPFSHDEVVHGKASMLAKMPGDHRLHFANLRALYGYLFTHPGKKLLFMGAEIAQWSEWSHERSLEWNLLEYDEHRQVQHLVRRLNQLYAGQPALHQIEDDWKGFEWIDARDNERSVVTFVRRAKARRRFLVVAANFTPVVWKEYRIGVPNAAAYRVVFSTDDAEFGGTGAVFADRIEAAKKPAGEQPRSIVVDLPPLSVVLFEPVPAARARRERVSSRRAEPPRRPDPPSRASSGGRDDGASRTRRRARSSASSSAEPPRE